MGYICMPPLSLCTWIGYVTTSSTLDELEGGGLFESVAKETPSDLVLHNLRGGVVAALCGGQCMYSKMPVNFTME